MDAHVLTRKCILGDLLFQDIRMLDKFVPSRSDWGNIEISSFKIIDRTILREGVFEGEVWFTACVS